jgi:S-adenosylmethionine synthetase
MGFRNKDSVELTVAMAIIDKFVESESQYFRRKDEMLQKINEFFVNTQNMKVSPNINCLDSKGNGISGLYLTVLGTSADSADSGEVGRGNMANRVISPSRPAGAEATAGKNPVSHIGKIYNALSFKIADEIYKEVSELEEVFVWMYNIIGQPVKKPKAVIVQPIAEKNSNLEEREKFQINEIVEKNLENIANFCNELIAGKIKIV